MARWSCSSTLFKYGTGRCRQSSARAPSALSCATAGGYAAWPSVLMTRGAGWFAPPSAFARKRLAATASCLSREEKIQGRSARVHRPVEVTPLAFHPDVRLVQAPAVIGGLQVAT